MVHGRSKTSGGWGSKQCIQVHLLACGGEDMGCTEPVCFCEEGGEERDLWACLILALRSQVDRITHWMTGKSSLSDLAPRFLSSRPCANHPWSEGKQLLPVWAGTSNLSLYLRPCSQSEGTQGLRWDFYSARVWGARRAKTKLGDPVS